MSGSVPRHQVPAMTLTSGLSYAIASLGAIPLRYGAPRFPSIKRLNSSHYPEQKLMKIGGGQLPPTFALSTYSSLGKPANAVGNNSTLRNGINLLTNSGGRMRVSAAQMEVMLTATIFSNNALELMSWAAEIVKYPTIRGITEFANGTKVPVRVEITPLVDWVDALSRDEQGASPLEKLFSINVQYKALVYAVNAETLPLIDKAIIEVGVEGEAQERTVEIELHDEDDWP